MKTHEILIIEDDDALAGVLSEFLAIAGYASKTAKDGNEGLELLVRGDYSLVLCDLTMPGISGLDTLSCVREMGYPCAVVMMTANSRHDRILESLRLGATDYLVKPFETESLIESIPRWLEIGRSLQKIDSSAATRDLRKIDAIRLKLGLKQRAAA